MKKYKLVISIEVEFDEEDIEALFDTKLEPRIREKLSRAAWGDDDAIEDVRTSLNLYKLPDYYVSSDIEELEEWEE